MQNTSFPPSQCETNEPKTRTFQYTLQLGQFDYLDDDMFSRIRIGDRILHLVFELHLDHDQLHLRRGHAYERGYDRR